jgi:adenylate cyclase
MERWFWGWGREGTLDKYIGDEVMATFGTPRQGEHDAANALLCATSMQDMMMRWNKVRAQNGGPEIRIGIGLHYGPVVLGDIGGGQRFEFAVIGDTVNVANRLERLPRQLDAKIVASDALIAHAQREHEPRLQGILQNMTPYPGHALRGRREPIDLWGWPVG